MKASTAAHYNALAREIAADPDVLGKRFTEGFTRTFGGPSPQVAAAISECEQAIAAWRKSFLPPPPAPISDAALDAEFFNVEPTP